MVIVIDCFVRILVKPGDIDYKPSYCLYSDAQTDLQCQCHHDAIDLAHSYYLGIANHFPSIVIPSNRRSNNSYRVVKPFVLN